MNSLYPIFQEKEFKKFKVNSLDFKKIKEYFKKNFKNSEEISLISEKDYTGSFFKEKNMIKNGEIDSLNKRIRTFIIEKDGVLKCINAKKKK